MPTPAPYVKEIAPNVHYIGAEALQPVSTSVQRIDDMPTVTVSGRFDWKFWAGIAAIAAALYILSQSARRAARHG